MNNKFVNMPTKYKEFLNEVKRTLNIELLKKLSDNSISYDEVSSLYKNINIVCKEKDCSSFDINKMIHGYEKKSSIIEILRKIASVRNKYIVSRAYKLPIWKDNIKSLKDRAEIAKKDKKIKIDDTEKAFLKLLKKYKYDWDGMWSNIEIDKNDNIKNINVFDIEDFEFIVNNLE